MQWLTLLLGVTALPCVWTQSYDYINATEFGKTSTSVTVGVSVNGGGRNATAPLLYGWMHEDISHSGDGGIYGEALVNRAFQGSGIAYGPASGLSGDSITYAENPLVPFGPVLTGWKGIGNVSLSLTVLHPLSAELPIALQVDIAGNQTGEVGILNEGWWGIDVRPGTYNASFYILQDAGRGGGTPSEIDVSLRSNLTTDVWSTTTIPLDSNISNFRYQQITAQIKNTATAPNSNNTFAITFNATEVADSTYYIALASLFPPTYNNRPNGIRQDLGQAIVDLGTKFLRFPGGNNIEGYSIEQRWKWNETIGPLEHRPGRVGTWGYFNTDGLGLLEYLQFCEDGGIEPLLAVYAGYSLDLYNNPGPSYPQDAMGEILHDILNEIEYITGATTTTYGALRASHGHPDPFSLNYIEIGNEDGFSSTYNYRFPYLYQGIKAQYPNITLISTAFNENSDYTISIPEGGMWDTHHYQEPSFFLGQFDYFDNWQEATNNTGVTILIGEYSVFQYDEPTGVTNYSDPPGEHIVNPNLIAAIGESVYLIGAERNPEVVKMTSYAPSFVNLNWVNWTPDLVGFTANRNETVLSTSYYLQQLFAHYRGSESLPVTTQSGDFNPLWWVATIDNSTNEMYFKVTNSGNSSIPLTINLDTTYSSVNGTILTSPSLEDFNYINNQTAVSPAPITDLPAPANGTFTWSVPAFSINVLQFDLA